MKWCCRRTGQRLRWFWVGLAIAVAGCSKPVPAPADLVLTGGIVHTIDDRRTVAEAIAIRGKRIVAVGTDEEIRGYAQRTNLPAYTRKTITTLPRLLDECRSAAAQGYAYDNEEAEIDVGCIGVLLYDGMNHVVAGLSVSAPIERRRDAWVNNLIDAARQISARLGHHPTV